MYKLILFTLLVGCGKPLIPDKVIVDAPEEVTVTHEVRLRWEFIEEYCNTYSRTNEELESCLARLYRQFTEVIE